MNGRQFIRAVVKLGRKSGIAVRLVSHRGKGGHQTLYYGGALTVVKTGEIGTGLLHAMCKQLGIDPKEL